MTTLLVGWVQNCFTWLVHISMESSHCIQGFRSVLEIRKDFACRENILTVCIRDGNICK